MGTRDNLRWGLVQDTLGDTQLAEILVTRDFVTHAFTIVVFYFRTALLVSIINSVMPDRLPYSINCFNNYGFK